MSEFLRNAAIAIHAAHRLRGEDVLPDVSVREASLLERAVRRRESLNELQGEYLDGLIKPECIPCKMHAAGPCTCGKQQPWTSSVDRS